MGYLNTNCYTDSSDKFSGWHVAKGQIPPTWILLDSQSTLNLFKNADLLMGIKTLGNQENAHTYAGMRSTKQVGHQPLFKMDTRFYRQGIANILSLAIVTNQHPVAFKMAGSFFTVHLQYRDIYFQTEHRYTVLLWWCFGGGLWWHHTNLNSRRKAQQDVSPEHGCWKPLVVNYLPVQ